MVTLKIIRHVPAPIIGVLGPVPDRTSAAFEDALDWLEAAGVLVERVEPDGLTPSDVDISSAKTMQLPAVFVNGALVSEGRFLTRHELAHLVAQAPTGLPAGLVQAVAAIGAAAAIGNADAMAAAVREAKACGLEEGLVGIAQRTGTNQRTTHEAGPAA